jgi:radical SAM family uncharacterized protein
MGHLENVALRTVKRKIRSLSGNKIPVIAGHKLLYTCNLRCKVCPFWRRIDPPLLSLDEETKMMDSLASIGVSFMGFEGGEPFLRKELLEILKLSHERFFTSLVSNGWMLANRIKEVREYVDYVFVSIDGVGEVHDRLRGVEGSFERAREGIAVASKEVPLSLSSTITSENTDQVERIVDFAREMDVSVSFQVAYDYSTAEKMFPSSAKLREALFKLLDLKKSGAPIVESKEYFESVINSWYNGKGWKCKPWLVINIDPEGRVVLPCYALSEYTGSKRVWEIDLPRVWNSVDWEQYETCNKCALSCYLEPSLFSWDNFSMVKERIIDNMLSYIVE